MTTGKISILVLTLGMAACGGGAAQLPSSSSATTTAATSDITARKKAQPTEVAPAPAEPAELATPPAEPTPEPASAPEPCEARMWWSCTTTPLEGARKVDKRTTLLVGDSSIDHTHSGTTDGRNPVVFTSEGGDVVSVALRRKPGNKSEIVLRTGKSADKLGGETIIDRHDADDFQYVSVIGTVQNGSVFVDVRYMR